MMKTEKNEMGKGRKRRNKWNRGINGATFFLPLTFTPCVRFPFSLPSPSNSFCVAAFSSLSSSKRDKNTAQKKKRKKVEENIRCSSFFYRSRRLAFFCKGFAKREKKKRKRDWKTRKEEGKRRRSSTVRPIFCGLRVEEEKEEKKYTFEEFLREREVWEPPNTECRVLHGWCGK